MELRQYEELTIRDNFIFTKVMSDPVILKKLLARIIPGISTEKIKVTVKEKTFGEYIGSHGIRIDVFAEDDTYLFAVEMQMSKKYFSAERTRYYQSIADSADLSPGTGYRKLKDLYIIFICPFDPFDDDLFMYTFTNRCHENGKELNDRTTKIFINCCGKNIDEYPLLKPFARYIMGETCADDYVFELDESVRAAKMNPLWRKEYMDLQMMLKIANEEGDLQRMLRSLRALQDNGISFEDACRMLKLTEEEIRECKDSLEEGMQTD